MTVKPVFLLMCLLITGGSSIALTRRGERMRAGGAVQCAVSHHLRVSFTRRRARSFQIWAMSLSPEKFFGKDTSRL